MYTHYGGTTLKDLPSVAAIEEVRSSLSMIEKTKILEHSLNCPAYIPEGLNCVTDLCDSVLYDL